MLNSIHKQVLAALICISLVNTVFLGSLNLLYGNYALKKSVDASAQYARESIKQTIEKDIYSTDTIIQLLTNIITHDVDPDRIHDPLYLESFIEAIAAQVEQIASVHKLSHTAYVYLNPELTGQAFDVYYADQNDDGILDRQATIPVTYFLEGPLPTDSKEWWFAALEKETEHWTSPYIWTLDNGRQVEFISITKAIYFGDTLFGVVGTDYTYSNLKENINQLKVLDTGYAFLLSSDLNAIFFPENEKLDLVFSDLLPASIEDQFSTSFDYQGQKMHLFIDSLSNEWLLGVLVDDDEIIAPNRKYGYLIIITMIISLIQSIIFAFLISRYLSKPLLDIATHLQSSQLIKGELKLSKKLLLRKDEIGTVAKSLVIMNEDVKKHLVTINRQTTNLNFLKQFDELTGLPNETHFKQLVANLLEETPDQQRFIIIINIDGFRLLNGLFGVHICNQLLRSIGERLESLKADKQIIARLSGDEFILCYTSKQPIYQTVHHLQSMLNGVYHIKEETIHLSCTMGISTYPSHSQDINQLIKFATIALNHSKANKKNDWFIYAPSVTNLSSEQFELLRGLRECIQNKELSLMIQPQVNTKTGKIVGGEVLVRWTHQGKEVPPSVFIPLSENTKLILPIGAYVLKESMNLLRELKALGSDVKLSINISVHQLSWQQIYSQLKYEVAPFGIKPEDLTLEITESTLLHANQEAREVLETLAKEGFKIAVDDFGTGYSSLSYIKKFRFDTLKLDRMFIKDYPENDDGAIASMIIALAQRLKVNLIAEGMETQEQVNYLKENGCTIMQGYFFSKPLSVEEFMKLIESK